MVGSWVVFVVVVGRVRAVVLRRERRMGSVRCILLGVGIGRYVLISMLAVCESMMMFSFLLVQFETVLGDSLSFLSQNLDSKLDETTRKIKGHSCGGFLVL